MNQRTILHTQGLCKEGLFFEEQRPLGLPFQRVLS